MVLRLEFTMSIARIKNNRGEGLLHLLCKTRGDYYKQLGVWMKSSPKDKSELIQLRSDTRRQSLGDTFKLLIDRGCDPNEALHDGRAAPLDCLCSSLKGPKLSAEDQAFVKVVLKYSRVTELFEKWIAELFRHSISDTDFSSEILRKGSMRNRETCNIFGIIDNVNIENARILFNLTSYSIRNLTQQSLEDCCKNQQHCVGILRREYLLKIISQKFCAKYCNGMSELFFQFADMFNTKLKVLKEDHDCQYARVAHSMADDIASNLTEGMPIDEINKHNKGAGGNSLHTSAKCGFLRQLINLLSSKDISVNAKDAEQKTIAMIILRRMREEEVFATPDTGTYLQVAQKLLGNPTFNYNEVDESGATTLILFTRFLFTVQPLYGEFSALCEMSSLRNITENIEMSVDQDYTFVMILAKTNQHRMLRNIASDNIYNINWKAQTKKKRNALHIAGRYGHIECIRILLDIEPGLCNVRDESGLTPLFYIIGSCEPNILTTLIDAENTHPWDYTKITNLDESLLDYYNEACKAKPQNPSKVIQKLLAERIKKAHTSESARNKGKRHHDRGRHRALLDWPKSLYENGTSDNRCRKKIRDVLNELEVLKKLFEGICRKTTSRAAINATYNNQSALMWCAIYNLSNEISFIAKIHEKSLNVGQQTHEKKSALHLAAEKKHFTCVKKLLNITGFPLNSKDELGNTALYYICEKFHPNDALKVLQENWEFNSRNNAKETVYVYCEHVFSSPNPHQTRLLAALAPDVLPKTPDSSAAPTPMPVKREISATTLNDCEYQAWNILKAHSKDILNNFTRNNRIFDELLKQLIISPADKDRLCRQGMTDEESLDALLDYLPKRGKSAFRAFLDGLINSDQSHVVQLIETFCENEGIVQNLDFPPPSLYTKRVTSNQTLKYQLTTETLTMPKQPAYQPLEEVQETDESTETSPKSIFTDEDETTAL